MRPSGSSRLAPAAAEPAPEPEPERRPGGGRKRSTDLDPDRDAQFRYVNEQARGHMGAGQSVISVDMKKKELVGDCKNAGRQWRLAGEPALAKTHDFLDRQGPGKAVLYGIYDIAANTGRVCVGTNHDTAAFAVASIRRWWKARGRHDYPVATRVLITADAGGSNGYRTRAWKT